VANRNMMSMSNCKLMLVVSYSISLRSMVKKKEQNDTKKFAKTKGCQKKTV